MKKVMIGLTGCFLLALTAARPRNFEGPGSRAAAPDTTGQSPVHSVIARDTLPANTPDTSFRYHGEKSSAIKTGGVQVQDSVISLADDGPVSPAASGNSIAVNNTPAASTPVTALPAATTQTTSTQAATPPATNTSAANTPAAATPSATTPHSDTTKLAGNTNIVIVNSNAPNTKVVTNTGAANLTVDPNTTARNSTPTDTTPATTANPASEKKDPPADLAKSDDKHPKSDTATTDDKAEEQTHQLDRRWFIAPLTKFQFQDFAMLEKNRKGYLSDANTLPFFKRGNASFAISAYKNLTNRLSFSADIGLSFGHATNNDVLISQTQNKTYNLLNAALYYHLISPAYRLQPYITIGFNDIINDRSYPTIPVGIGAKFNSRSIMVVGQIAYGASASNNVASTTMYSVGIYIPIKSKKQKQLDEDNDKYNKNKDKDEAKKKDTANKNNNGGVVNNIYITINMDSVLKAKGLLDDNGNPFTAGNNNGGNGNNGYGNGRRGRGANGSGNGGDDGSDDENSARSRRKKPFKSLGLDDFEDGDYKIDSLDGTPTIHFVVYFEFNDYGLNSKAFGSIDKVIRHLKRTSEFSVEIKGYTDSVGTDQYNNMLSRKRAKMILDYMNSRGVPTELMKAKAYGSDSPVADNSDPNTAWLNRRAEIIVHRKDVAAQ